MEVIASTTYRAIAHIHGITKQDLIHRTKYLETNATDSAVAIEKIIQKIHRILRH